MEQRLIIVFYADSNLLNMFIITKKDSSLKTSY